MPQQSNGDSLDSYNVSLVIGGESVEAESKFSVINPVDGNSVWTYSGATTEHAQQALQAAEAAFTAWSSTNVVARSDILRKAADLFLERREDLAKYMKLETAADDGFIAFNIEATSKQIKDVANRVTGIQGSFPAVEDDTRSALVIREPYGVVIGIAPW